MAFPDSILQIGVRADQPAATDVAPGTLWSVTDEGNVVEQSDGTVWVTYAAAGGGGGTPGGADTQVQYNNAGAFGGITGATTNGTALTLVAPVLGTPASVTLTNATGLPISTGVSGLGANVATFLGTPSSANLAAALTDETGTGANVFATSPTLVTPALGTPSAAVLTNATGLPLTTGVTGTLPIANGGTGQTGATAAFDALAPTTTAGDLIYHNGTDNIRLGIGTAGQSLVVNAGATAPEWATPAGGGNVNAGGTLTSGDLVIGQGSQDVATTTTGTGVVTALGVNTGSAGAFVVNGGALGTPSSGTLTNATGLPIATGVSGLAAGVATFLGTPSSANLATAVSDETGTGALVFATSPTLVTPALGTPSALVLTNATGLPLTTGVTGTLPVANVATLPSVGASFTFDGGGSALTTGVKLDVEMPFAGTLTAVRLFADVSGSIVVDIWKDTYANFPPTVADTITAAAKPTITTATKSEDTTLTGWTTAFSAGDVLRFNVDSVTTITRCTLSLRYTRT